MTFWRYPLIVFLCLFALLNRALPVVALTPSQALTLGQGVDNSHQASGYVHYILGTQLLLQGELLAAKPLLTQAVAVNTKSSDAVLNLAVVEQSLGNIEVAEDLLKRVLVLKPHSMGGHYYLGRLYAQDNRVPQAISHFKQATELEPLNAELKYDLGVLFARQENYPEAALWTEQAIQQGYRSAQAYNNYGYALAKTKRLTKALNAIDQSLSIDPENPATLDSKGYVYFQRGEFAKALTFYEKALALDESIAEIHLHQAQAHDELKHYAAALKAYQAFFMHARADEPGITLEERLRLRQRMERLESLIPTQASTDL